MFWRSIVPPGIVLQALLQEPVLLSLVELAVPLHSLTDLLPHDLALEDGLSE